MDDLTLRARLNLWPRNRGGRKGPIRTGYRPALWFGDTAATGELVLHSCVVRLLRREAAQPGDTVQVDVVPIAIETWPKVTEGTRFDVFEGTRPVGRGELLTAPRNEALSAELRRSLALALEDWVTERFGSKVERTTHGNGRMRPDLIGWFEDHRGERQSIVVEVVARKPGKRDVERLARLMDAQRALLGLILALDEPSQAARAAAYEHGSVDLGSGHHVSKIRMLTSRDLVRRDIELLPGAEPEELQLAAA
jgi:uncharacterized membrane-anchored protein